MRIPLLCGSGCTCPSHDEATFKKLAVAYFTKQGGEALKEKMKKEDKDHFKTIGAKGAEIRWARYRALKVRIKNSSEKGTRVP